MKELTDKVTLGRDLKEARQRTRQISEKSKVSAGQGVCGIRVPGTFARQQKGWYG